MFEPKVYPEGKFKPRRGLKHNWRVWCCTGVLQVLGTEDFVTWLNKHPKKMYTIRFAGRSRARIALSHPLWEKLKEISENYLVKVSPLSWSRPYTEQSNQVRIFKTIKIGLK